VQDFLKPLPKQKMRQGQNGQYGGKAGSVSKFKISPHDKAKNLQILEVDLPKLRV